MIVPALFLAFTVQDFRAAAVGEFVTVRLEATEDPPWKVSRNSPLIEKWTSKSGPGSPTEFRLKAARPGVAVVEFRRKFDRRVILVFIAPGKAGAK